ncbi:hypothetical protein CW751_12045 [Brumimicrobium salinarum]|uniref:SpaA-like prealbumin fold domain-containing protein n=1 Tax=Brumimicrobium salinarum TaxID=2058658 RepID=A0A2I0R041_9FLAO|nr:prealbumin-like fold domain-containing protein [Brumimicrobium salinarum]PKR79954.1 hypothetical protein CW751_12045 [Brumimicrobium salinarum]
MRNISIFLSLTLFLIISITSGCKKESIEQTTGDLIVNAIDINGTPLDNETVYLYNNEADFNNVIYSKSLITNSNGRVTFLNLVPGVYYVDCDFENMNGGVTTITGQGSVSSGYETEITIQP